MSRFTLSRSTRRRCSLVLAGLSRRPRAQTERRALSGDRVAIYNLAGQLARAGRHRVAGRRRRHARRARRRAAQARHGRRSRMRSRCASSIRRDRIVYPEMGYRARARSFASTSDGTFDDRDDGRDWFGRDRVEIRDSGCGPRRARRSRRERAEGPADRRPLGRRRRDRHERRRRHSRRASPRRRVERRAHARPPRSRHRLGLRDGDRRAGRRHARHRLRRVSP